MRGNSHVRFGERAEETDRSKGRHCASARLDHYYASLLIRHGESVKVIQRRLGHKAAKETLDTYGHLWPYSGREGEKSRRCRALSRPRIGPWPGPRHAVGDRGRPPAAGTPEAWPRPGGWIQSRNRRSQGL